MRSKLRSLKTLWYGVRFCNMVICFKSKGANSWKDLFGDYQKKTNQSVSNLLCVTDSTWNHKVFMYSSQSNHLLSFSWPISVHDLIITFISIFSHLFFFACTIPNDIWALRFFFFKQNWHLLVLQINYNRTDWAKKTFSFRFQCPKPDLF